MKNWLVSYFLLLYLPQINAQELKIYQWEEVQQANPDTILGLDCSKLKWTQIPNKLFGFKNLRYLDLSKNKLSAISDSIEQLDSLRILDVSKNNLTAVAWMCQLSYLKRIHLSRNQISVLPECIGNLTRLQTLDLWDNPIGSLPESLTKCSSLKSVDLRGILFNLEFQHKWSEKMPQVKWEFDPPCNCVSG